MVGEVSVKAEVAVLVTVKSKSITGVVSVVVLLPVALAGSPPPVTLAGLITLGTAVFATFTGNVMVVEAAPGAMAVARVQTTRPPPLTLSPAAGEFAVHVHPAPAVGTAARVSPVGKVSVIVYEFAPVVSPPALVTLNVYTDVLTPTVRLATDNVLLTTRSGHVVAQTAVVIVLLLLPLLAAGSLPPDTVAMLVTLGTAAAPGNTVKVIRLGLVPPAAIAALLVQESCVAVEDVQVQPVPLGVPTIVSPLGILSITV